MLKQAWVQNCEKPFYLCLVHHSCVIPNFGMHVEFFDIIALFK